MNGEVYYIVGKPAELKNDFFDQLAQVSRDNKHLLIPRLFTTDPDKENCENIYYLEGRDFELRNSMGIYCLTWTKAGHKYGVCAEGLQWAHNGHTIIINGSLHNIDQALRVFPEVNIVLLRHSLDDEVISGNTLLETENARLDWVYSANGVYCPYMLSLADRNATNKACQMLLELIEYNKQSVLDKAV